MGAALYFRQIWFTTRDSAAFSKILSEARKYNLSLVFAHQFTSQLPADLRSAILGIVYSMVVFQVGLEDAKLLQGALPNRPVDAHSLSTAAKIAEKIVARLQNLSRGEEAIFRSGVAYNNFYIKTYPPPPKPSPNFAHAVIEYSRTHYGKAPSAAPPPPPRPVPQAPGETFAATEPPPIDFWQ